MGFQRLRSRSAPWLPGRTPGNADSYEDRPLFALGAPVGRPLGPKTPSRQASGAQDALPASPLEPKTLSRQATWAPGRPSRQAYGAQDTLPTGLWDPRRPPGRPMGSKTPSRQVPWSPGRSPGKLLGF